MYARNVYGRRVVVVVVVVVEISTVFITGEIIRGNKKKLVPKKLVRPCIVYCIVNHQKSEIHTP